MSQITKPVNIPTYKKENLILANNLFDPIQNSPPNIFLNHLKYRISKFENTKDCTDTKTRKKKDTTNSK